MALFDMSKLDDAVAKQKLAETLDFSRPLDVHTWSEYPEVNAFIDHICTNYLHTDPLRRQIERKHIKVVVLDVYVAWLQHPEFKIAVHKSPNAYKAKGNRYNALHISKKVIYVVNQLVDVGLLEEATGFIDRDTKIGRLSRIWASKKLISLFKGSNLEPYWVSTTPDKECIILRNEDSKNIPYDDTPEIIRMRELLRAYNDLLARSFIDIRRLDKPWIPLKDDTPLLIGQHRQKVHRIFNRGEFSKGGRFYGPWWQGCPKEWRREIFINDAPTIERDFSSLHVALLYATKGFNYYQTNQGDAYQIDTPDFLSSPEQTRSYAKLLFLMAINAKTDKKAFAAFRSHCNDSGDKVGSKLTDKQLNVIISELRDKHPIVADGLGSDAGIDLMNIDSLITEHIIKRFTDLEIPILTIHDSYIVNFAYNNLLNIYLEEAYNLYANQYGIKSTVTGVIMNNEETWKTNRLPEEAMIRSEEYKQRHINWMVQENERTHKGQTAEQSSCL